ncbi:MAG: AraC family transcriptional regulator [Deltaproteobacteria bacterium]|nr:AraC family transcriptional regulator [Deltaproteobacteria bacterium]
MHPLTDETIKYEYLFRVNRAIDYVHAHYAEDLNLNKLAQIACFSPFHFHRLFRLVTGETVNDFSRRIRLEKSLHKLVLDKGKSITEIAMECGFSSSQNFAKVFKARYGVTPSHIKSTYSFGNVATMMMKNLDSNNGEKSPQTNALSDHHFDSRHPSRIGESITRQPAPDVKVVDAPDVRVAYVRNHGPYNKKAITPSFAKLEQWAAPKQLIENGSVILGVLWSKPDVTPEDKMIFDACITVPKSINADKWVNIQMLPGGKFAVYHCEVESNGEIEAWIHLVLNWLISSGYQPDERPLYQIYYNDPETHPLKHQILDLCLPIKPLYE